MAEPSTPHSGDTNPLRYIPGFDGLRAIAFMMVFISHKFPSPRTEALGSTGVWIFFVLSGYLISRILVTAREKISAGERGKAASLVHFYLGRFGRIAPAYFAFLTVMTLLELHGNVDLGGRDRQLSNWLLVSNFYIERHGWYGHMGHLWSLALEQQYYLAIALFAFTWTRCRLGVLASAVLVASLLAHIALWAVQANVVHFDVNLILNASLFAFGTLAALNDDRAVPRWLLGDAVIALVLAACIVLPILVEPSGFWLRTGRISGALMALLLMQVARAPDSRIVRWLEIYPIKEVGVISYGAYLIHPVIDTQHVLMAISPMSAHGSILLDLILSICIAKLSFLCFEKPARDWIKSLSNRLL